MIRFFSLLARREDVSPQEFHDHWRHPHGSMGRLIPGLATYVQAHQVHTDVLGSDQDRWEGVAISSFDSPAAAAGLLNEPQYTQHVAPDEPSFQDLARNRAVSTEEEVLLSRPASPTGVGATDADGLWDVLERPTSIQLLQFIDPGSGEGWTSSGAEAGRRLGAFRIARNTPSHAVHGDEAPFAGVWQLWWPTLSAFESAVQADPSALDTFAGQRGSTTMLTITERFVR